MEAVRENSRRRAGRFYRLMVGFAIGATCVVAAPAGLLDERDQVGALQKARIVRLQSWLAAQNGAVGSAELLARSVLRESTRHALDPVLVLAVIHVESRFDRNAVSSRGAQGLMQVQRIALDELVGEGKLPAGRRDLRDPLVNVEVGVSYLAHLVEMFGDLPTALAAYNWGPSRIREKIAAKEEIPSAYVQKVLTIQRSLEVELARVELEKSDAAAAA